MVRSDGFVRFYDYTEKLIRDYVFPPFFFLKSLNCFPDIDLLRELARLMRLIDRILKGKLKESCGKLRKYR